MKINTRCLPGSGVVMEFSNDQSCNIFFSQKDKMLHNFLYSKEKTESSSFGKDSVICLIHNILKAQTMSWGCHWKEGPVLLIYEG